MKNLKKQFRVFFLAIVAVTFSACNNDDDVVAEDTSAAGESLIAKIDGADFNAMEISIVATTSNNVLSITGGDSNGNTFQMAIQNYTGEGTYVTGDAITNSSGLTYITISPVGSWSSTLDIGNGMLEVTSDADGIIEGTFEFDGYNGPSNRKQFREGAFKANIE